MSISAQDIPLVPPFQQRLCPPPVGGGFAMKDYWVWCGSVVHGNDGRYHMFASRWPKTLPFMSGYKVRSEVVRAVSDIPEGPYTFREVVLPVRDSAYWDASITHNPAVRWWGGRYYLFYIGATAPAPAAMFHTREGWTDQQLDHFARSCWKRLRIGLAVADRPEGPWQRFDEPILDIRPDQFDSLLVTNPAPCIHTDGSVLMIYRASRPGKHLVLGAAWADQPEGPYRRLTDQPIRAFDGPRQFVEDPCVWWQNDHYEMLAKDLTGYVTGEFHAGVHAWSLDGVQWRIADDPKAYSRRVTWAGGTQTTQGSLERPQLLFQNGKPTHVSLATADGPGPANGRAGHYFARHTWNIVMPLQSEELQ